MTTITEALLEQIAAIAQNEMAEHLFIEPADSSETGLSEIRGSGTASYAIARAAYPLIARAVKEQAAKVVESRAEELMRGTEGASIQEIERRGWHLNLSQSRALKQIAAAILAMPEEG